MNEITLQTTGVVLVPHYRYVVHMPDRGETVVFKVDTVAVADPITAVKIYRESPNGGAYMSVVASNEEHALKAAEMMIASILDSAYRELGV